MSRSNYLRDVIDSVEALGWHDRGRAHHEVAEVLLHVNEKAILSTLRSDLGELVEVESSVEKTTHYKWLLAEDREKRFKVWLHEYKPKSIRREGHAAVPHNHRFWLSSLILRGGFTDSRFERAPSENGVSDWIKRRDSRTMAGGDTMVLSPDEIHSLSGLEDGTISLIVEGQAVRSYSEVFENGTVHRYYDLEAKLSEFQQSL